MLWDCYKSPYALEPLGRWDVKIQSLATSCREGAKKGPSRTQGSKPEGVYILPW
jgi:hypothetical protein